MTASDELDQIFNDHAVSAAGPLEGAMLPLLHGVQSRFGYIPSEMEPLIAKKLNVSAAEVRGIVSFYHDFRTTKPGMQQIKICCAEACQARGARALSDHARAKLNIDYGETTVDGRITLDKAFCLGNCACGPTVMLGEEIFANVDAARFDDIIEAALTEQNDGGEQ